MAVRRFVSQSFSITLPILAVVAYLAYLLRFSFSSTLLLCDCPSPAKSWANNFYPRRFLPIKEYETPTFNPETYSYDGLAVSISTDGNITETDLLDQILLPSNGGFVKTLDEQGAVRWYGVSMFHQLHCLNLLRAKVFGTGMKEGAHGALHMNEEHLSHCLSYIAQVRTARSHSEPNLRLILH